MRTDSGGPRGARVVGGFFLFTAGIHLGLVAADPEVYRSFADAALFGFGIWLWCIPAIAVLVLLQRRDSQRVPPDVRHPSVDVR